MSHLTKKKAAPLVVLYEHNKNNKRRYWMKEWYKKRGESSHMTLLKEINETNPEDYFNYFRMNEETFNYLLNFIRGHIVKQNTLMRESVSPEERLAATLRYLVTGLSFEDLKFSTRISAQTLRIIVPETCEAIIYNVLGPQYLKMPNTKEDWLKTARDFDKLWNFPNCGGAIDGKHIKIMKPMNSGSYYYNYKGFFSIVLMAVVNAHYEFMYVDVGANGRVSDGGVFESTSFNQKLQSNNLNLPDNFDTKNHMNFVFIADEAFPLHTNILKPYSQRQLTYEERIFNYRLSRARRIVENAYGIMASRFRILHREINLKTDRIDYVVLACCVLHNFLRKQSCRIYTPKRFIDYEDTQNGVMFPGEWRREQSILTNLDRGQYRNASNEAKENRKKYTEYFNNEGKLPWQDKMV